MADILAIAQGETWRKAGMVKRADGDPITTGTVNYYLKCLTGGNAGNWWRNSDQSWQVSETANAMTHQADGMWTIELAASPFTFDNVYVEYAKESGDLHVPAEGRIMRARYVLENSRVENLDNAITVDGHVLADMRKAQSRTVADVGEGSTAHLLQSPDEGVTTVSRFDAATDEVTTDTASRDASKATGFLTTLGVNAPANWINAAAVEAAALNGKGDWNIGKDNYSLTQAFPTNFASLGINASGHISRVVLCDTTTANTDMRGTNDAALATTALSNATWTDAKAGFIDVAISSRHAAGAAVASVTGDVGGKVLGGGSGTIVGTGASADMSAIAGGNLIGTGTQIAEVFSRFFNVDPSGSPTLLELSTYDGSDTPGTTTLLTRIAGTLAAGTHEPQSGDSYAIVNSGTHGNAALKTLIDTVDGVVDAILLDTAALDARLSDELMGRMACILIGNVADARTAAEVFTYGGVTGTVTADADGNRTIIFT